MDVQEQRLRVVRTLADHGWRQRDSDPTDFQFGTDPSLRFKIGTQYREITVTAWRYSRQQDLKRATTEEQVTELLHWVDRLINIQMERGRVEPEVYRG